MVYLSSDIIEYALPEIEKFTSVVNLQRRFHVDDFSNTRMFCDK